MRSAYDANNHLVTFTATLEELRQYHGLGLALWAEHTDGDYFTFIHWSRNGVHAGRSVRLATPADFDPMGQDGATLTVSTIVGDYVYHIPGNPYSLIP